MRQKISDLKEIIDLIYDVRYCGKSLEEVASSYIKLQKQKQQRIAEHIKAVRQAAATNRNINNPETD